MEREVGERRKGGWEIFRFLNLKTDLESFLSRQDKNLKNFFENPEIHPHTWECCVEKGSLAARKQRSSAAFCALEVFAKK